jgi:dihydroorotase
VTLALLAGMAHKLFTNTEFMSQPLLIRSAEVVRASGSTEVCDVLLQDGKIVAVDAQIAPPEGVRVIEAKGMVLLPGLFDTHAHLREPGHEDAETIATGALAALRGGITGLVMMPDTIPPIDNGGMVQSVLDVASKVPAKLDFLVAGCISKRGRGEELAEIADMMERGAVMITDEPNAVGNPQVLRRALQYTRGLGLLVTTNVDIPELTGSGCMNDGKTSYRLGLPGMHSCSEEICLARDIRLAQSVNTRIHIHHISTARSVETIARYKKEGMAVTVGVTPHHLIFSEENVGDYDTNFKVKPPLRTKDDRLALQQGLREGIIDVISTDHSPYTEFEKEQEFATAPFGMTSLDTALPSLYANLIQPGVLDWGTLVSRFSRNPRRLVGLPVASVEPGQRANLVLFNPHATSTFIRADLGSKSLNTPYLNQTIQGQVALVVLNHQLLLDRTLA